MITVLQRVRAAHVEIDGQVVGRIGAGLLALVCAEQGDTEQEADKLLAKVLKLRIFSDAEGKMNRSVQDVGGGLLIVSQFTLAADASEAERIEYPEAARQRSRAEAVLAEALAELRERGVDAIAQIPSGDPGEVISEQARRLKCDLIVIGHRHLSRLERLFEPSIGQWTIDHAPCPVLVETRDPQP